MIIMPLSVILMIFIFVIYLYVVKLIIMILNSISEGIMGCGGKDVTLEVFESYLKKLLHVIDKLPNLDKEKAVMILKNSANHYYELTVGQTLHTEYFQAPVVSQCQESVNNFPAPLLDSSSPFSPLAVPGSVESPIKAHTKLESEAILAEITDLAGSQHLTCLTGDENTAGSESWDRHLENTNTQLPVFSQSLASASHTISPRCALCSKLFASTKEVTDHYQPVSCIGCKKELCNKDIFAIHYHACKGIKHYQAKIRTNPALTGSELSDPHNNKPSNLVDKKSSGKKQTYKCHECSKSFVTAFQLNKHLKGHNDNNCDKCDAKFAKRKLLVNHLKTVHYISTAENYYLCNFCPRKFVKRPSLWAHYSEHTVGSQVVCLKCGQIMEDAEMMARHTQEHQTSARHTCERCGEFFARKQQYLAHIVGHEKYRCKLCGKDFSSKKKLKLHKNVEHDSNNTLPSKSKVDNIIASANHNYTCVVCLQNYKNKTLFNAHDCSKDGKKNEKNKAISKEVSVKLSSSKYKCRFCEFEHKKSSAVVRHARIHRNKKRFVCELCGTAFSAHYTLKEHRIYVHSEDRKFPCDKCDKTFKARNALIRHEKQVHSDAREHVCHCGQMFKRATHLKRHVATSHKGETLEPSVNTEPVPAADKGWAETGDTTHEVKFKSNWDSTNKFGIPAAVALDVVTSLDLNVRMMEHRHQEAKEKGLGKVETEKPAVHTVSEPEHRVDREGREVSQSGYNGHSDYSRLGYSQAGHARYHAHPGSQTERFLSPGSLLESSSHSRYYPASLPRQDKEFDIHSDKLYLQQQGVGPQDKMYLSPPAPTSNTGLDRNYPIDDRAYSHGLVSRSCEDVGSQIPRTSAASNLDPLFTDAGPADLTMTRSSMSGPSPREASHYSRHHPSRLRYSNYTSAAISRTASSSSTPSYPSHSYPHRLQDFRPGTSHHNISGISSRNIEQVHSGMDSLDDPYRPLSELSYSQRQQGHYMDTSMDNYLPHDREELELSQCDKKKLYKNDKFYRTGEHQDVMNTSHREEGVLLPPLLALAPHHQHSHHHPHTPSGGGQASVSPQNIKLDYLCGSQSDQIASQYIQDGIDYNNII